MNKELEYKSKNYQINVVEEPQMHLYNDDIIEKTEDIAKISDKIFKKYQQYFRHSENNFNSIILINNVILEIIKAINRNNYNLNDIIRRTDCQNILINQGNSNYLRRILLDINIPKLYKTNKNDLNIIFGYVFEKLITKKETGAFYTDIKTTRYITENALVANIINQLRKKSTHFNDKIEILEKKMQCDFIEALIKEGKSLKTELFVLYDDSLKLEILSILSKIKIIDISCGAGSFLFSAYYLLKDIYKIAGVSMSAENIFNDNLYGIDIDREAIALLDFRINLERAIEKSDNHSSFNNFVIGNCLIGNRKNENLLFSDNESESIFDKSIIIKNIILSGGFDVVLGNPPYLEYRKVSNQYLIKNFKSEKCNNLYAFVLEKNLDILKDNGNLGMIIPVSYSSTKRMYPIRNLLIKNSKYHFCSNYADRPSCLFNGVHQKLNIILIEKETESKKSNIYTSSYFHWYRIEKDNLFNKIRYFKNDFNSPDFLIKVGNEVENSILRKIFSKSDKSLLSNTSYKGKYKVWLNMRMCFWAKAFTFEQNSNEYKVFSFDNELDSFLFSALINSNLFFFIWESISDVWHITQKDLNAIKIDFDSVENSFKSDIKLLYQIFENNIEKNKVEINSKQTNFEYRHKNEKKLIDEMDKKICELFDLTLHEVNYVKLYQIKYRMNGEIENYLKSI